MTSFVHFIEIYGLFAVFVGAAIDHTGTPTALLLSVGLASAGILDIRWVLLIATLGSLAGDILLYAIGKYGGKPFLTKIEKKRPRVSRYTKKITHWFDTYGNSVVVWGRFAALVGRYVSLVCGILEYRFIKFLLFSLIGNIFLTLLFGIPTYLIGEKVNRFLDNGWISFLLIGAIVMLQIVLTWIWYLLRRHANAKVDK